MIKKQALTSGIIIAILFALVGCKMPIEDLNDDRTLSTVKEITAFSFTAADNAALPSDITTTITGTDIQAAVPFGTDLSALVPTIVHTGASISPVSRAAQDFGSVVKYTVTAQDASTQEYSVTVTATVNAAKEITTFGFTAADNTALSSDITATITGTDIQAAVPFGTDLSALVPTVVHTGASINPVSGAAQDFSTAVTYTVTADDNSTEEYTVTIEAALTKAELITMINNGDDVTNVNTSQITNMDNLFRTSDFNQDISGWDVSKVESMNCMFYQTSEFNQDISGWNVTSVKNTESMFESTGAFNQDISSWKFNSLEKAGWMFKNAKSFNRNISSWSEHFPETEITHQDFSDGDCPLPIEFYPASWNL